MGEVAAAFAGAGERTRGAAVGASGRRGKPRAARGRRRRLAHGRIRG